MLPLICDGVRGPHCLGDYSASVYDNAVEKQSRRVDWLLWDVSSSRNDKEGMAFSVGVRQSFNRWDEIGLQQIEEVLLSSTALESLGNVAIDEKRLRGKS